MKKTLRLLLFEDCNRSCEGCCNKQWDLNNLPVVNDFTPYDEIILTGGEPMLKHQLVRDTIHFIRKTNQHAKIIMYTAMTTMPHTLAGILYRLDGLTVTLHNQDDVLPWVLFDSITRTIGKSLRLNVFDEVDLSDYQIPEFWQIKDNIEWLEDCPLPDNEVFMRL